MRRKTEVRKGKKREGENDGGRRRKRRRVGEVGLDL